MISQWFRFLFWRAKLTDSCDVSGCECCHCMFIRSFIVSLSFSLSNVHALDTCLKDFLPLANTYVGRYFVYETRWKPCFSINVPNLWKLLFSMGWGRVRCCFPSIWWVDKDPKKELRTTTSFPQNLAIV